MDAEKPVVEVSDQEIRIDFALNTKCRTTVTLKSLSPTTPIAFKVQTSSPHKFLVNPPSGVIPPASSAPIQFILKPQCHLPTSFPRSPSDRFLIKTVPFNVCKSPDSVNLWMSSCQATHDVKLKVVYGGRVLLRHAVEYGDVLKVRNLIRRDRKIIAELGADEGRELLRIAAGPGGDREGEMVKVLVDAGLQEKIVRDCGPLECRIDLGEEIFTAARRGDVKQLKLLLHDRASTSATFRDRNGATALHAAAIKGYEEAVQLLLEAGFQVDVRDDEGHTPLHLAVECANSGTVKVLINRRANVNARSQSGLSPLDVARVMGIEEIAEMLQTKGAVSALQFASSSVSDPPSQNKTKMSTKFDT